MALWTHAAGSKPYTVTVYEMEENGILYARAWDTLAAGGKGNMRRTSLGHRDKTRAKKYAIEQAAKLVAGEASLTDAKVTLARVFTLYEQYRTPKKSAAHQKGDKRHIELFTRVLGGNLDPRMITKQKYEAFVGARSSGAIDPRGNPVAEAKRKPVRTRAVEFNCVWLRAVFNWAVGWQLESGRKLLAENPIKGYEIARELNPRRPIATQDRFETIRAVSDTHMFEARWTHTRVRVRSYVSEMLDIVNGTGRRIRPVCQLDWRDIRMEKSKALPYGEICWPGDTDKEGVEHTVPMGPQTRAAIDRVKKERPGISGPLFPSPGDPEKPISRDLADKWLRQAERMAGVQPLKGKLWHAYRGKWATERKNLPDKDVAAAGGWKSTETLKLYQQTDAQTMLAVVLGGGELREVKKHG